MSRYNNNKIYADYEFDDETSAFDPNGRWVGGSEYYAITFYVRVPRKMLERAKASGDFSKLDDWLFRNQDNPEIYRKCGRNSDRDNLLLLKT